MLCWSSKRNRPSRKWNACSARRGAHDGTGTGQEFAERTAIENAKPIPASRHAVTSPEALTKSARQPSSLGTVTDVLQQIVKQLSLLIPNDRCAFSGRDVNGIPLVGHAGLPAWCAGRRPGLQHPRHRCLSHDRPPSRAAGDRRYQRNMQTWKQPEWLPEDRAWLGIPLYAKNKVMGMLTISRSAPASS